MKKIISSDERKEILKWVFDKESYFIPNPFGENRKYLNLYQDDLNQPDLIFEIKKRILKEEKVEEYVDENIIGDLISFNAEGGYIQKHTDPTIEKYKHIRYNLFLSKPYSGGDPVYSGKIMQYEEECYLTYRVDTNLHWSLPVIGKKPRIAISYGIYLPI